MGLGVTSCQLVMFQTCARVLDQDCLYESPDTEIPQDVPLAAIRYTYRKHLSRRG